MKDLFDNFCSLVEWKTSPALQEYAWLSPGRNKVPDKAYVRQTNPLAQEVSPQERHA